MRLPRFLITMRGLMVLVVIVSFMLTIAIEATRVVGRRSRCQGEAQYCGRMERYYLMLAARLKSKDHRGAKYVAAEADRFRELRAKYEYAANRPWVKMPPPSPPPHSGSDAID
jgi:Tfp pilus assembly protein PilE